MIQVLLMLLGSVAGVAGLGATHGSGSPFALGDLKLDSRTPYFSLESAIAVGRKGEESLDVSIDAACGEPAWLFHRAELVVRRNRFGDVQVVGLPSPGCVQCAPVKLRWFHEPTGYLNFEVHVHRRWEIVSCSD